MATALAAANDAPAKERKVVVATGAKLAAFIPQTLEEAWKLAGALAHSGMTPKSYGSDQNKIMVGMMAGAEVGLTPMAALQSIAVIGNNPSLWGDGALGLIQASGLLEDMEETDDGHAATCTMKRKGRTTPIVRSFSMDDAKRAGLSGKAGPWAQYPARMRQMRARAFAMRDGFADVLRGLHIAEEARDYAPMQDGGSLNAQPLTGQALLEQAASSPAPGEGSPAEAGPTNETGDGAEPVQQGRDDADTGEIVTLDSALAEIEAAKLPGDVTRVLSALEQHFDEEDRAKLKDAANARIGFLRNGGK